MGRKHSPLISIRFLTSIASVFFALPQQNSYAEVGDSVGGSTVSTAFTDRLGAFDIDVNGNVAANNLVTRDCDLVTRAYETGFLASNSSLSSPQEVSRGALCRSNVRALTSLSFSAGGVLEGDWQSGGANAYARRWAELGSSINELTPSPNSIWASMPLGANFSIVHKINPAGVAIGFVSDAGLGVDVGFVGTVAGGIAEIPSYPDSFGYPTRTAAFGVNTDRTGGNPFLVGLSGETALTIGSTSMTANDAFMCRVNLSAGNAVDRCRFGAPMVPTVSPFQGSPVTYQSRRLNTVSDKFSCQAPRVFGSADYMAPLCSGAGCIVSRVAITCSLADAAGGSVACAANPQVLQPPRFYVNGSTSEEAEYYTVRGVSPDGRFAGGHACQAGNDAFTVNGSSCANASLTRGIIYDFRSSASPTPTVLENIPDRTVTSETWRILTINQVDDQGRGVGFGKRGNTYYAVRVTPNTRPSAFSCTTTKLTNPNNPAMKAQAVTLDCPSGDC